MTLSRRAAIGAGLASAAMSAAPLSAQPRNPGQTLRVGQSGTNNKACILHRRGHFCRLKTALLFERLPDEGKRGRMVIEIGMGSAFELAAC